MRQARDPLWGSVILAVALVASGFVFIWLGWHGSATTLDPAEQLTYFVSGGLTGVATIATGATVLLVQHQRRASAVERDVLGRVVTALADREGRR